MPVITIDGPPINDLETKRFLVRSLTRAAAHAFAIPEEKIIVLLHESRPDRVAVAGTLISDKKEKRSKLEGEISCV
ncbi:MAG: 4-oxalocrotonate tautomerase [Desulfuromonas sp.]|nr:MAG: 4-oxalocrotonate tautomerase [Desulfuromonas sp.]